MSLKFRLVTIGDIVVLAAVLLFSAFTLYPFLYCLAYSLSDSKAILVNPVYIWPVKFTLENYRIVFINQMIMPAFSVSVTRTVVGVLYTCVVTGLASYALTKTDMPGRRFFALLLVIPMYLNGGIIANYVNIYQLGLFNNFMVYILPAGFVTFYMLIMRTYFNTIPSSLDESARLDGASEIHIFIRIIFPLSMPIIATVALFAGVWQWNSWFDAMVYTSSRSLRPLQMVLQSILLANDTQAMMRQAAQQARTKTAVSPETLQMATLIVAVFPIIIVYPFLQKYFVKGMMIGAVKS